MPDLIVAGAGVAGLAGAAEARSLGAEPLVLEKREDAGGSMVLSSGVVWRHRDFERFRAECPDGDERLQRTLFENLDGDLDWIESLGAPVVERDTGNPLTTGVRLDVGGARGALMEAAGEVRLGEPLTRPPDGTPLVLATGGFQANPERVREHITPEPLMLRAAPGSTGDGLRLGLAAGAAPNRGLPPVLRRHMPAPP